MGDYRKLQVWERAHRLTLEVYGATRTFPKDELFGLTSQLRRAASSIPANIAEGCGRNGDAELARFLTIAMGSANELDYHLLLSRDLGHLDPTQYGQLAFEGPRLGQDARHLYRQAPRSYHRAYSQQRSTDSR